MTKSILIRQTWSMAPIADLVDLDVRTVGAERSVEQAGHDDFAIPEARIVAVVSLLNLVAALVPVVLRSRLTHVSCDSGRCAKVTHLPSKGF